VRLTRVTIEGYRSIRERLELDLDDRITIVLGANDHGKTNVLHAVLHLNEGEPFDAARDLNWDLEGRPEEFPSIRYRLALSDDERQSFLERENGRRTVAAIKEFVARVDKADDDAHELAAIAEEEARVAAERAAELEQGATTTKEEMPDTEAAAKYSAS
jgi:recombinational DNA repair ATPase RecF